MQGVPVAAPQRSTLPAAAAATRSRLWCRVADVAVVGSSLQAYAAAYLLAKRGKRTVLVEHAAPQLAGAAPPARPDVALHLPAASPHSVSAATEAFALWRGIEASAEGARGLLHLCGSIDVAPVRGSSAASDALGAMQDASRAAGLQFGMLSPDEVSAAFPRLRPPKGSAALYTNAGGVVNGQLAAAVLRAMAKRAGAVVAPSCLLGWRDAGGHLALRTAPLDAAAAGPAAARLGSEGEVVYECEQLVLLPEAAVQQQSLALFGLAVPQAQLWRLPASRWRAQEDCAALPLWQLLGAGSTRTVDDPTAIDSAWGFPVLGWAPGSMFVAQCLPDGSPAEPAVAASAAAGAATSGKGSSSGIAGGQLPAGSGQEALAAAAAGTAAAAAGTAEAAAAELQLAALAEERPGSEEAVDAERQRQVERQWQEEAATRRLATAGALAGRLINGIGSRLPQQDSQLQLMVTPDGEPAVGSHPGFEAGRVVAAFPATGTQLGCLPGDQLAPLVARLAADELLGRPPQAVSAAAVALGRDALAAEAVALPHDSWLELARCLAAQA